MMDRLFSYLQAFFKYAALYLRRLNLKSQSSVNLGRKVRVGRSLKIKVNRYSKLLINSCASLYNMVEIILEGSKNKPSKVIIGE